MSFLHNLICRINAMPIIISASYFLETGKLALKLVKCETIKLQEGNRDENLCDLRIDNDFSNLDQKTNKWKKKNHKLDFIKIKHFCFAKFFLQGMKRQATELEKIFTKCITSRKIVFKTQKNSQNLKISKKCR